MALKNCFDASFFSVTALVLALGPTGCQKLSRSPSSLQESVEVGATLTQPQAVMDVWNQHVTESKSRGALQADCVPRYMAARVEDPGTKSRGIVVLLHGLTACPQQFFGIGQKLADQGYDVFLPLLPGHGLIPDGEPDKDGYPKDRLDFVPGGKDRGERFHEFISMVNALGREGSGTKLIGGLSAGGAFAVAASTEAPELWTRGIYYAPFFKIPGATGPLTAFLDVVSPGFMSDWGAACKAGRNLKDQRHGYCSITADAVRAVYDFAAAHKKKASVIRFPTMYVATEDDPTSSNDAIYETFRMTPGAAICFYKKGVPHSMLSRYENMSSGHYWMDALERDTLAFLTAGVVFPMEEKGSSSEYGQSRCRM